MSRRLGFVVLALTFFSNLCLQSLGQETLALYQTLETKGSHGVGSWNVGNHTFVGVKFKTLFIVRFH